MKENIKLDFKEKEMLLFALRIMQEHHKELLSKEDNKKINEIKEKLD